MQHWHSGDDPVPRVMRKLQHGVSGEVGGFEVKIEPGAGSYEDQFRFYWLFTAWMLLAFHGFAIAILLSHMAWGGVTYLWLPHAIGTAIIVPAFACIACIYRFILFPPPGYYSRSPNEVPDELLPYYGAASQRSTSFGPYSGPQPQPQPQKQHETQGLAA